MSKEIKIDEHEQRQETIPTLRMELLCALAGKVVEFTVEPIGRELGYLISYHSNVKKLKDEFKELQNDREAVQHLVDDAQRQGEDIEVKVQDWFSRVNEITELVEKVYGEETHANTNCSFKSCPNLWLRHQISRKAKKMTLEVAEIKEKAKFDKVSFYKPPDLVGVPSTSSSTANEGMQSRISIMSQVLDALADPNVDMVGLCGLPGVGKTTLAKQVVTKAKEQKLFDKVVWVTVAQNPDSKGIQMQVAENVGMKLDAGSVLVRASHLNERLKKEKNLLVVLDDLWERLDLHQVGIPFENDENNKCFKCTILLTSRNEDLLYNQMNCKRNIKMDVMSEEESLKLFKENAELSDDSNHIDLLPMAVEVVQQCGGLPLAIVAVARSLKNKRKLSEWRCALNQLKRPLQRNMTGIKEVDVVLKYSYDHLDTQLQSIVLLSAMLSHDPLIIDLLMYSMGLSLLQDVHSMKDAQDALDFLVSKLKASSLLLDSFSNDRFTMHDVFREFSLSIASKEQRALVVRHEEQYVFPSKTLLEGYTRMFLDIQHSFELPEELHCPTLEFFLLNSKGFDLRIPSTFFKPMNELKVMGLTNVHITSLPSSISLLEKLTTLCLHSCELEDVAVVGKLTNLTILSLASSSIKQLPCELAQLTCLKMLNLANCTKLEVIPPKVLSSLKGLEVLYMENSFDKWEGEGCNKSNENASVAELRHLTKLSSLNIRIGDTSVLPNDLFLENSLERYKILIGEDWEWSSKCETSNTLKLKLHNSSDVKAGIQKLLESVEDLFLEGNNGLLSYLDGREFPHLKHLWIVNNHQIEYVVSNSTHLVTSLFNNKASFPMLETLNLEEKKSWITSIWDGHLPHNSFGNLKTLTVIEYCFLVKLVPLHVLICLSHLEELEVRNCLSLEMVFDFDDLNNYKETQLSWIVPLKKIKLACLPKLMHVWSNDPQQIFSFPNLQQVTTLSCHRLKSMFPTSVAKGMHHLEELTIGNCGIDVIVAKDEVSESGAATFVFPKLNKLSLSELPNLKNLYGDRHTSEWPCLQHFVIGDCNGLEIFRKGDSGLQEESPYVKYPLFFHQKVIPNLKKLTLDGKQLATMLWNDPMGFGATFLNLKELEVNDHGVFDERFSEPPMDDCFQLDLILPNLESLDVGGCSNLIKCGPSIISFKNLIDIDVKWCHRLTYFLTSSTATSLVQLTRLKIYSCDKIEEIIAKERDDEAENEIINFKKLRSLQLEVLPRLKSFCSHNYTFKFPSLDKVMIRECTKMSMFCGGDIYVPLLKGVDLGVGTQELGEINLNKTIQLLFTQKVTNLELYHEMKNLWVEKLAHDKPFSKLKRLIVDNCDFSCEYVIPAHLVKSFGNLKELEVRNCEHVETIFDVKGLELDEEARTSLPYIGLRKLKLDHLPNLKCLWTQQDHDGIGCFQYLRELEVCECESLTNILVASTVKGLTQLDMLTIESCEVLEVIVAEDETSSEEESPCFEFPQLSYLELKKLPNLKSFFPRTCTFECPQLTRLLVFQCEKLKTFGTTMTELREKDEVETQQPLFLLEKVIPRLEGLTLNQKDVSMIRNGKFEAGLFDQVKGLCLESFSDESVSFPYSFLERFPNLVALGVAHSCFEEILPSQAQMEEVAALKSLYVGYMDQLKTIWIENDDSHLQPIHQDLESLQVESCGSLIMLTPSFASFEYLTHLTVSGCRQLIYLVTSSTAKSLVRLERLEITDCERMEEIVRNEISEENVEATIIAFYSLKRLQLSGLRRLKRFCSQNHHTFKFHKLEDLSISGCHQMKMFCPGMEIDEDESSFKGDLNEAIEISLLKKVSQDGRNMYEED